MQQIILSGNYPTTYTDQNPSPYSNPRISKEEKLGKYQALYGGLFKEVFEQQATEAYRHFVFDTKTKKLKSINTAAQENELIDPVAFAYDFGARMYDARLGKFLSVDKMIQKQPSYSPYLFAGNKPILAIDYNGDIEIIIHEFTLNEKGKYVKSNTYSQPILTSEDVKGITRTAYEINVYGHLEDIDPADNSVVNKFIIDKQVKNTNTGLDAEQVYAKENPIDYCAYRIQKGLGGIFGASQMSEAQMDRELNGEYKPKSKKILQTIDAVMQMISLGRATFGKQLFKEFITWEIADAFVTELTHLGSLNGFTDEQNANLSYYALKFAYQGAKGDIKNMYDILDGAKDMQLNSDQVMQNLLNMGVDVNIPSNKDDAAKKAIDEEYGK